MKHSSSFSISGISTHERKAITHQRYKVSSSRERVPLLAGPIHCRTHPVMIIRRKSMLPHSIAMPSAMTVSSSRSRGLRLLLEVNAPHMIFHVVRPAKDSLARCAVVANVLTFDTRIVLSFMPSSVLLAAKAASQSSIAALRRCSCLRLWTPVYSAEEVLRVSVVVFAKVTTSRECRSRCTPRIGATPCRLTHRQRIVSHRDTIGV